MPNCLESIDNQLAVIGYIKLASVKRYLFSSRHISPQEYSDTMKAALEPAMRKVLANVSHTACAAALDYVVYGCSWALEARTRNGGRIT